MSTHIVIVGLHADDPIERVISLLVALQLQQALALEKICLAQIPLIRFDQLKFGLNLFWIFFLSLF